MKASRVQLAQLIADETQKSGLSAKQAKSIAAYLLETRRTTELASLLRDVQAAWAKRGYVEVIASSAHELTAEAVRDIEAEARRVYPDAKKVVITPRVQPDLIGGVRLEIIDHQLDLTTRGKLTQFKMLAVQGKDA